MVGCLQEETGDRLLFSSEITYWQLKTSQKEFTECLAPYYCLFLKYEWANKVQQTLRTTSQVREKQNKQKRGLYKE